MSTLLGEIPIDFKLPCGEIYRTTSFVVPRTGDRIIIEGEEFIVGRILWYPRGERLATKWSVEITLEE